MKWRSFFLILMITGLLMECAGSKALSSTDFQGQDRAVNRLRSGEILRPQIFFSALADFVYAYKADFLKASVKMYTDSQTPPLRVGWCQTDWDTAALFHYVAFKGFISNTDSSFIKDEVAPFYNVILEAAVFEINRKKEREKNQSNYNSYNSYNYELSSTTDFKKYLDQDPPTVPASLMDVANQFESDKSCLDTEALIFLDLALQAIEPFFRPDIERPHLEDLRTKMAQWEMRQLQKDDWPRIQRTLIRARPYLDLVYASVPLKAFGAMIQDLTHYLKLRAVERK